MTTRKVKRLWFFAGWNYLTTSRRDLLLDFQVTDVVLGMNTNVRSFKFYNEAKIVDDCKWLKMNDIRIHLMPWVNRTNSFLDSMNTLISDFILKLKAIYKIEISSILLDVEKHWIKNTYKSKDYLKEEDALTNYIQPLLDFLKYHEIKLGTTSLLKLPRNVKKLASMSDYTIPQAYSVYFPKGSSHWSHNSVFIPGKSQEIALEEWGPYSKKIVMGLACYYEARPKHAGNDKKFTQIKSLTTSLMQTLNLGIDEVAYWDIKQCVGQGDSKRVRREFLKKLITSDALKFDRNDWITFQRALSEMNYYNGKEDGIAGPKTIQALENFRKNFDLKEGVELNTKDLISILDNFVF